MAVQLDSVVPFGRSLDEYTKMFNLTETELQNPILSVADGPASFNAEGTRRGYQIKSVDPLYCFSATEIKQRFDAVVDNIIQQVENTLDDWVWSYHHSPSDLRKNREAAIRLFCQDFASGKTEGRYDLGELPQLSYTDASYQLGLCSHFLFLYSEQFDQIFHLNSICELLRICQEVRIFPLVALDLHPSPHLEFVINALTTRGYQCDIQTVAYEFQRNGNKMLKITQ
ncbi:SAM-dependent methyltransferase [Leptothoe sp. LEGE 181152]|nr:SAM-dependent methyltransferase [Leptothoe sp. LEGE 181152]